MHGPYHRVPALGRDLPSNYAEAEKVFDERVKAEFPVGMSEDRLVAELRKLGFRCNPDQPACKSATVTRGLVFRHLWSVRWRASNDQVDDVWGVYGVIAP